MIVGNLSLSVFSNCFRVRSPAKTSASTDIYFKSRGITTVILIVHDGEASYFLLTPNSTA